MNKLRLRNNDDGFIKLFFVIVFALVILAGFAILALIGLLVFKTSIMLGAILILGIAIGWLAPWFWIKLIGGFMTVGAVIATLIMLL